jgi:subtilisin family serine protease
MLRLRFVAFTIVLAASVSADAAIVGKSVVQSLDTAGRARVIVALRERPAGVAISSINAYSAKFNVLQAWPRFGGFAADITRADLDSLSDDANVLRIDEDSGGTGGDQASLALIGAPAVQAKGITGANVTVAVLDSGVEETHPDIAPSLIDEQCFCTNADGTGCCPNRLTSQNGSGAAADEVGHGTNVAGIMVARGIVAPIGVAPGAKLVAVRVLDASNRFSGTAQVISGLDWVLSHHPEVRVVNMSLYTDALFQGYCDTAAGFAIVFARAIAALRANGTLVFACSGNSASATMLGAPACLEKAIAVGAVFDANAAGFSTDVCSDNAAVVDRVACFSNGGLALDLLGPGVHVTSAGRGGTTSTFTGTSQATPHAAGAAALLFSLRPDLGPDAVESLLKESGRSVVDSRTGLVFPRVDVLRAVLLLQTLAPRHRAAGH